MKKDSMTIRNLTMLAIIAFVGMALMLLPGAAHAERYKVMGDKNLYLTGYLSQKLQFGLNDPEFESTAGWYQLDGADQGATSILSTLFFEAQLEYNDNWEFRLGLRGEMDTADTFQDDSPAWDAGSGQAWNRYSDVEDVEGDDSINDIIREFTIAYFSRYFSFRAGKQQVGWGQADGLRLMDQINALDLRKDFILRDSDEGYSESRIPVWMLKMDITPDYNFGSAIGLNNLDLELDWIPDIDVSNRFAVGPRNGGPWGFPLPDLPLPLKQLSLPEDYPDRDFENSSWGARLKGTFGDMFFTINYFYGWQKGFVLTNSGLPIAGFQVGNVGFITDPNFEGNVADAGPDLSGAFGLPFPMYGLSLELQKKLYRTKFVGFTISKELQIMPIARAIGQKTLPVLRIEAAYEFDKPFNIGIQSRNTAIFSDWIWVNNIEFRDVQKYLIGLDWNTHIPFINTADDVWVSAQFSQSHIDGSLYSKTVSSANPGFGYPGGESQRLQYAPYYWFPKKWETFTSLLVNTAYVNDDLKPQILWVHDWTYHSFWIKYRLRYELGDHWRFDVGYYQINGKREQQMGIFENSDCFYTLIKYQF